jgi:uncharacterized protein (TIGR02186 family)
MSGCCRALAVLGLMMLTPIAARADGIVADLSSHLIAITTGFSGTSVILFGAIDGPGDVIAVVRGPERDLTVWRKGKIIGLWANVESMTFANVPSFYAVAASRPIEDLVPPGLAALHRIGIANLKFEPEPESKPDRVPVFTNALIDAQQRAGRFPTTAGKIAFLGNRLFRTTITVPTNVPTGIYRVDVFLVRDRDVVSGQTTPLAVSKVGVDATVFDFARSRSFVYGMIAVLTAMVAGWMASLPFRGA